VQSHFFEVVIVASCNEYLSFPKKKKKKKVSAITDDAPLRLLDDSVAE